MTTEVKVVKKCSVCGESSEHYVITSTSYFGSSDLDTRPPELLRYSIKMWIQLCPSCGFSAPDISEKIENAKDIVFSKSYQNQLNNPNFPKTANAFLCYSMICENINDFKKAGWGCVQAAWICDDEKKDDIAKICRKKAIELFKKAIENGEKISEEPGGDEAILVDLLRRSGEFEEAFKICESTLEKKVSDIIKDVLIFQKFLIEKEDLDCYTIDDAISFSEELKRKNY